MRKRRTFTSPLNLVFRNCSVWGEHKLSDATPLRGFNENKIARLSGPRNFPGNANCFLEIVRSTKGVFRAFVRHVEFRHFQAPMGKIAGSRSIDVHPEVLEFACAINVWEL